MEEPLPDLIALRRQHLPEGWSEEQKLQELLVPRWLLETVERCLQKRPEDRFLSAIELHDHIVQHLAAAAVAPAVDPTDEHRDLLQRRNEELARRNEELRQQLHRIKEEPVAATPFVPAAPPAEEPVLETTTYAEPPRRRSGTSAGVLALLALLVMGGGIAGYSLLKDDRGESYISSGEGTSTTTATDTATSETDYLSSTPPEEEPLAEVTVPDTFTTQEPEPLVDTATLTPAPLPEEPAATTGEAPDAPKGEEPKKEEPKEEEPASSSVGRYKVVNKAYFHNEPDEATRREAFIIHWNNAVLQPTREENGFVYVVFTNHLGQTSKGWLKKSDLVEVKE